MPFHTDPENASTAVLGQDYDRTSRLLPRVQPWQASEEEYEKPGVCRVAIPGCTLPASSSHGVRDVLKLRPHPWDWYLTPPGHLFQKICLPRGFMLHCSIDGIIIVCVGLHLKENKKNVGAYTVIV